ncbi:MAG: septation protein SepH [Dietzia psychralcaliphila]
MRKLRIIGVDADSSVVECEVPDSGEKLALPLDDRFRAAARGESVPPEDARRVPVTGTLRPREIQDRIRHGASPEDVAADAGVPMSRIEGFAVPVLLERANAADLARASHPVLPDGPALDTLADRVESALDHRGVDPDVVAWDAWRDRAGGWIVRTSWPAGLSDDASATWSFVLDSHGGSTRALDDEAQRILDPSRTTALRTVSSPPPLPPGPPPIRAVPTPGRPARREPGPTPVERTEPPAETSPESAPPAAVGSVDDHFLQHPPAEPERRAARRHPTMPSWEDVLLGVRGKDD